MKRVLVCAALIVWSAVASAVVYKWTDAQGNVHYGDQPPDGVPAQIVEGLGYHVSSLNGAPAAGTSAACRAARCGWRTGEG